MTESVTFDATIGVEIKGELWSCVKARKALGKEIGDTVHVVIVRRRS